MTINELYSKLQIRSPMKILSAYNGRVICYNFNPNKEEHKKLGKRQILDIWAEMRVTQNSGFETVQMLSYALMLMDSQNMKKLLRRPNHDAGRSD